MNFENFLFALAGFSLATACFFLINNGSVAKTIKTGTAIEDIAVAQVAITETNPPAISQTTAKLEQQLAEKNAEIMQLKSNIGELLARIKTREEFDQEMVKARKGLDKIKAANQEIAKNISDEWSDQEIDNVYPEPFNNAVKGSNSKLRTGLQQFQLEPIDQEWADKTEIKIRDFFSLHEFGHQVKLITVECKSYRCQIMLNPSDVERKPWKRIFDDMTLEPWWHFHSYSTVPVADKNWRILGVLIFMEASR